jgi:IS1 family transposase
LGASVKWKARGFYTPDSEFDTPRIHFGEHDYAALFSAATESSALLTQSDLVSLAERAAWSICFASGGVNRTVTETPLAFCVPIFGLPACFFIIMSYKYVDRNINLSYSNCNIKIDMPNILKIEKKIAVIAMLAEGSSIRSIERITGVNRNTIMSLGLRVGDACAKIMDTKMRDLSCKHFEVDEIWGFIGAKRKNADKAGKYGDVWTFIAIDADSKLIPSFVVGKRDAYHAKMFMDDLASRVTHRVQISSDALAAYEGAVEHGFGANADYGHIVKTYSVVNLNKEAASRYSPADVVSIERTIVSGMPDVSRISTSHIESQNLTLRMHCRRLTRLTNAFSKKFENFEAAVALNFAYYNFCKIHGSLRMTPAMAAGVEKSIWTVSELVKACGE